MSKAQPAERKTASTELEGLARQALDIVKKARKHGNSLGGNNFYGNKLAELRADATNSFSQLTAQTAGDTSALAELTEAVFAIKTPPKERIDAARELAFSLRTTWKGPKGLEPKREADLFPLTILTDTKRGYLITIGRQMNGCYSQGWYDSSAVMMRRLLEICIIEAFEKKGIQAKIKDGSGNYLHLTDLIAKALAEDVLPLSRNSKKALPQLRDVGHMSAHGRYFLARKEDLERVQPGCRIVIEELLHHANLL